MVLDHAVTPREITANVLTAPFESRIDHPVELLDTTLREGEQTPGVVFTEGHKMEIAAALDEVGVHAASVGFPAVSAEERRIGKRIVAAGFGFKTAALCRVLDSDIDHCLEVGPDQVSLFLGGSESHLKDKLRLTETEALGRIERAVARLKEAGVMTIFGIEDFSRTPPARLVRMLQVAADAGVDQFSLPDTIGVLTPTATHHIVRMVRALFPEVEISLHFHNDLGLALANTLAGLEAGARVAHVTVNGIGERCGNTRLEELAVVLKIKYGLDLGLNLERLHHLSQLVHRICGTRPGHQTPVTGQYCFTHESGIHVAGLLANREAYQPYPPELVGRRHEIVFGKHSGLRGVLYLAEREGLELPPEAGQQVLAKIKEEAERGGEHGGGSVPDERVLEWLREAARA